MHGLQILGLVLVALGVVLLIFGINAARTLGEDVRQELTGEYSSSTMWYIIGGAVIGLLGLGLAIFGGRVGTHHPTRAAH